jgi:hypothetical protein
MVLWARWLWPLPLAIVCGIAAYPAQRLPRRPRAIVTFGLCILISISPILIAPRPRFLRLIGSLLSVTLGVKVYDLHHATNVGIRLSIWEFCGYLCNPFALVLRRVMAEPRRPFLADMRQFIFGAGCGAAAILLTIRVFEVHWKSHPFALEHCVKVVSLFLIIQFLGDGLAAAFRIAGFVSTDFGGPFFLARTPAEFWRWYNRPAGQFLHEYIFTPAAGRRRLVQATLATFAFSGIVHEYVFDVPAGRILGTQMAFFLIQGLAAVATIRLKPRGWLAPPAILATLAFNLLTALLFFSSVNAVLPFYVSRVSR